MKRMSFKPKTMLVPCIGWNIQITVFDWSMESRDLKGGVEYLSTTTTERRPTIVHLSVEKKCVLVLLGGFVKNFRIF